MKWLLLLMFVLCSYYLSTDVCWSNEDCPPYRFCHKTEKHEVCNYLNPCVCSNDILSIITGEECPISFDCQSTYCTPISGHCLYEGNMD